MCINAKDKMAELIISYFHLKHFFLYFVPLCLSSYYITILSHFFDNLLILLDSFQISVSNKFKELGKKCESIDITYS
jgi:hypothetical protein